MSRAKKYGREVNGKRCAIAASRRAKKASTSSTRSMPSEAVAEASIASQKAEGLDGSAGSIR
ncbi:MAG: hypothetical protein R3C45_18360 [Phycisphaerales bacterium]